MATHDPTKRASTPQTAPSTRTVEQTATASSAAHVATEMTYGDATVLRPLYEAAVLYAANYPDAAKQLLQLQVSANDENIRTWLMLFDFYQLTNNHAEFEKLSLQFTVKFECSSPAWKSAEALTDPRRKKKRPHKDYFTITPPTDGSLLTEIERLEKFVQKAGSVRIDLKHVSTIQLTETEIFALVVQRMRKLRIPIWLSNTEPAIRLLKEAINQQTENAAQRGPWLMLFEIHILEGALDAYEELGMEYAVTFEVSPPPWEKVDRTAAISLNDQQAATLSLTDKVENIPLKGVLSALTPSYREEIGNFASSRQDVIIDFTHLLRIDFSAAGQFTETIRSLQLAQKKIVLSNVNELIAPLLEIFGVNKYATLIRKKIN